MAAAVVMGMVTGALYAGAMYLVDDDKRARVTVFRGLFFGLVMSLLNWYHLRRQQKRHRSEATFEPGASPARARRDELDP